MLLLNFHRTYIKEMCYSRELMAKGIGITIVIKSSNMHTLDLIIYNMINYFLL